MKDTDPTQTAKQEQAPRAEAIRVGMDLRAWSDRTNELMEQNARIITFRGAGTVNGIEPAAAKRSVDMLRKYVDQVAADGTPVALMFDGDADNREKPDVGSVFGGLVDALGENPNVTAIAAQTEGWYSPETEGGAIENASGKPYETYVFPDELPGSHASLTQSDALVAYPNYEQVFVGPAGPIAFGQLQDLSEKTAGRSESEGKVKVTIFETPNNPDLEEELTAKLEAVAGDPEASKKVTAKLAQREESPYGALFTKDGEFNVDPKAYPGVALNVVNPESFSDEHEQENQTPDEALKVAVDDVWKKYTEHQTPGKENQHPKLTLFTKPDEKGRYSKLTFGPLGFQGREGYEGAGNRTLIEHKASGEPQRKVVINKFEDGTVGASEPDAHVKMKTEDMSEADRKFHNAQPGRELTFARVDPEYFARLTDLLNQATPEKPKSRVSHTMGRIAARIARRG